MTKYIKSSRGFTLIELIISIAITGMVITAVSSFMIYNIKSFHRSEDQFDVQYHAQSAMNQFVDKVIGTSGILDIEFSDEDAIIGKDGEYSISWVKLDNSKNAPPPSDEAVIFFRHDKTKPAMFYGYKSLSLANTQFAYYITDFRLKPLPDGTNFEDCRGIHISISAKKGQASITVENEIYFRN